MLHFHTVDRDLKHFKNLWAESMEQRHKHLDLTSMGEASKTLDPRLHIRQLYGTEGPLWVVKAFQTPHPWFVTGAPFKILLSQLRGEVSPPPVDHQALLQKKKQAW